MKVMDCVRKTALSSAPLAALALLATAGCGKPAAKTPDAATPATPTAADAAVDDHSGWWCATHGVPEEVCAQCNAKLAAEFQKKGDWCKEHDRPESQCFLCGPRRAEAFAAQYEAKFGKQPPKPKG